MNVSRVGYTRCSACLCHVKVVDDAGSCPFCGETLRDAQTLGATAVEKLKGSRSALIAMGLAGGVTFAVACSGVGGPGPDPGNDYGGFDPSNNSNNVSNVSNDVDMGTDAGEDASSSEDVGGGADGD